MSDALIRAAKERNLSAIKTYIAQGANINYYDSQGRTALIWAASFGFADIVEYLLTLNPNFSHRSKLHETAFLAAVTYGKLNIIEVLIKTKKITLAEFEEGILSAVKVGSLEGLQYLCSLGIKHNARTMDGKSPFLYAVEQGYLDLVQYLYSLSPDKSLKEIDNHGNTALLIAAQHASSNSVTNSHLEIIDFLTDLAPNLVFSQRNRDNFDAYALALTAKNLTLAKHLLKKGCYVDITVFSEIIKENEIREFYNASLWLFRILEPQHQNGFSKTIQTLGKSLNGRHVCDGNTALHLAVSRGYLSTMMLLIYRGADIDIKNHANISPYQLAISHSNLLIQIAGHIYKTVQLLVGVRRSATFKPLENKTMSEQRDIANQGHDSTKRVSDITKKGTHAVSHGADLENNFEKELKITLKKLNDIVNLQVRVYKENLKYISYMYFYLGKALYNEKPEISEYLFQQVQKTPGEFLFEKAHYKIYYMLKHSKIKFKISAEINPEHERLYRMIKELLYSKNEVDREGVTLRQYIIEYTLEKAETIQKFESLSEITKQDSLAIKDDFLFFLHLLWQKNHRERELLAEISRLKAEKSKDETFKEDARGVSNLHVKEIPVVSQHAQNTYHNQSTIRITPRITSPGPSRGASRSPSPLMFSQHPSPAHSFRMSSPSLPTLDENLSGILSTLPNSKADKYAPLIYSQRTGAISQEAPPLASQVPYHQPLAQATSQPALTLHQALPRKASNSQIQTQHNSIATQKRLSSNSNGMESSNPIHRRSASDRTWTVCNVPVSSDHFSRATAPDSTRDVAKNDVPDAAPFI